MEYIKTAWRFITKSSANPHATSLTVKASLVALATMYTAQVLPAVKVVCELGYLCALVDPSVPNLINDAIDLTTDLVYFALMTVSTLVAMYGAWRKARRTFDGNNLAIK